MSAEPVRVVVAVEDALLRAELLHALKSVTPAPEQIPPEQLLRTEPDSCVLVFLETSNDTARLIETAKELYAKWEATGRYWGQFLAYATDEVMEDRVVFALWSVGPELTVIVQDYSPSCLDGWMMSAVNYARRILRSAHESPTDGTG